MTTWSKGDAVTKSWGEAAEVVEAFSEELARTGPVWGDDSAVGAYVDTDYVDSDYVDELDPLAWAAGAVVTTSWT